MHIWRFRPGLQAFIRFQGHGHIRRTKVKIHFFLGIFLYVIVHTMCECYREMDKVVSWVKKSQNNTCYSNCLIECNPCGPPILSGGNYVRPGLSPFQSGVPVIHWHFPADSSASLALVNKVSSTCHAPPPTAKKRKNCFCSFCFFYRTQPS